MSGGATKLTHNQTLVLSLLRSSAGPLTAYQILDQLKGQGITAPPTVYRALTRLTSVDFVHRIDSLNAYVACDQSGIHSKPHDGEAAFAICRDCGDVAELEVAGIRLPTSTAGQVVYRQCSGCEPTIWTVNYETTYYIGDDSSKAVSLADLRQAVGSGQYELIYVFHVPNSDVVTRIVLSLHQATDK